MGKVSKLMEALQLKEKCDPADCECETCPIGKKMALTGHDAGVDIVFTVCGMLGALEDVVADPVGFKEKDY